MEPPQQFCLKWNNHHSNLLSVFETLLHSEAFTDVTLAVDGAAIKCHKMVLAACSSYFHALFADPVSATAGNVVVVLKDVRLDEMRALLEYMYRGEVNVAQQQFPSLLSVAETLQIKGLVEEGRRERHRSHPSAQDRSASLSPLEASTAAAVPEQDTRSATLAPRTLTPAAEPDPESGLGQPPADGQRSPEAQPPPASSLFQSMTLPAVLQGHPMVRALPLAAPSQQTQSRSSLMRRSPHDPCYVAAPQPLKVEAASAVQTAATSVSGAATDALLLSAGGSVAGETYKRRHKLASGGTTSGAAAASGAGGVTAAGGGQEIWCENNPILRTVLGHGGVSGLDVPALMAVAMRRDIIDREYADRQVMSSTGSEETAHPTAETAGSEPEADKISNGSVGEVAPQWDPSLSHYMTNYMGFTQPSYGTVRPEWKRYKQYSKTDLQQALDAVKGGMTALQASRKFHVPSRTLYDKIKKMGIPTMPRRYPRSPGTAVSVYSSSAVAPSISLAQNIPANGDSVDMHPAMSNRRIPLNSGATYTAHQPIDLVVDRRREMNLDNAEDASEMDYSAATTQAAQKWPKIEPIADSDEIDDEVNSHTNASATQRQPMELVVEKRAASASPAENAAIGDFQGKWSREDQTEESRELDVVA